MGDFAVGPDDEDGRTSVVALSPILLPESPLAARNPGVVVENVGLQPRGPGKIEGLGRFGDPDGDHRAGGEVDLLLFRGQRLEVLDVLFVSRPVEGDNDRSPRGPHAQPELASLGAGQVELEASAPTSGTGSVFARVCGPPREYEESYTRILQPMEALGASPYAGLERDSVIPSAMRAWRRELDRAKRSAMRIIMTHGYMLSGTGSNIYVQSLCRALVGEGHDVHLLCQERTRSPTTSSARARRWTHRGRGSGRAGDAYSGHCTLYRPEIGDLLPVYVYDDYPGWRVKTFLDLTEEELDDYLGRNVEALKTVLGVSGAEAVITNHSVPGPLIARRAWKEMNFPT